ncbi:HSP20 family molecular chaperone IbpA [Paenibacillus sp. OAS669]|nr:HSP20 family molecular chaperone IbpA [Paenibacillus sp. OAS669]
MSAVFITQSGLPAPVSSDDVKATYKNGVLEVRMQFRNRYLRKTKLI